MAAHTHRVTDLHISDFHVKWWFTLPTKMLPKSHTKVPLYLSLVISLSWSSPLALAGAQPLPETVLHFWMAKAGGNESQLWVLKTQEAEHIELLYRLFCKGDLSTWWPGYTGKPVQVHIFFKRTEGLASGDVTPLPHLRNMLSDLEFPTDTK